ncbi:hypothetical protein JXJ21_14085 [candidate division KSB1 bacterium]|nr:hypothetical protein [candidate division KSB1 bacterium]
MLYQTPVSGQLNYYAPEKIIYFANYLFNNGEYLRAAGEYQRYAFALNNDLLSDSLLLKIGNCFQLGGDGEMARHTFRQIIEQHPGSSLASLAHYQIASGMYEAGDYLESNAYIHKQLTQLPDGEIRLKMRTLSGVNYLKSRDWKIASNTFSALLAETPQPPMDSLLTELHALSQAGLYLSYKSQIVAGMASAIIPGSGKIYAGRINDGLYSFFVVGLFSWQAYDGFEKDGLRSVKGWIYGAMSSAFYLGNVYGSIVSVKLYNQKLEQELLKKIELHISWK